MSYSGLGYHDADFEELKGLVDMDLEDTWAPGELARLLSERDALSVRLGEATAILRELADYQGYPREAMPRMMKAARVFVKGQDNE